MKPMIDSSRGWFTIVHLIVVPHTCNVIATNASCSDPCNDNGACNEQPHSLFNRRPVIINEPFVGHANSFHTMDFLCQAILKQLNKQTAPFKRFETWNWNTKCADVILHSGVYVVTRGETGLKQITRNKTKTRVWNRSRIVWNAQCQCTCPSVQFRYPKLSCDIACFFLRICNTIRWGMTMYAGAALKWRQ